MHRLLHQLCTDAPFGMVVVDDRGVIVGANHTLLLWLKAEAAGLLQRSWQEVFPEAESVFAPHDAQAGVDESTVLEAGIIHASVDCYVRMPFVDETYGVGQILVFFNGTQADAVRSCFVWTLQQWKILEQEQQRLADTLEQANSHLLRSEKLAGIGQLAAGVAHEINNPIGYVFSNLKTLAGYMHDMLRIIDAVDKVEHIDDIRSLKRTLEYDYIRGDVEALIDESEEGIDRVTKIITALKDFSHISEEGYHKADLHHGIETTLKVINNEIKYKAQVVRDFGSIPLVECKVSQINQVIMNLLLNAAHAITGSGVITIRTRHVDSMVWVEVADTGKGMAPEVAARVFEPFFTTKSVGQGTGLGLALSYSIVQKHHGDIDVVSEPGRGTTFRLCLPVEHSARPFDKRHTHVENNH